MTEIKNLKKKYAPDFMLSIERLRIEPGERIAIVGMNGSGKSTLLRLLAGQLEPDEGEICCPIPIKQRGYQPQNPYAFHGSAEYNIRIVPGAPEDLSAVLAACKLEGLKDKPMRALSGGERQRVFLARMLAGGYPLLLLDEPLSAADLKTGAYLTEVLKRHCEQTGATLLFATHLPAHAFAIANRILLLDHGCVMEDAKTEEMREPKSEFGKSFFSQWKV